MSFPDPLPPGVTDGQLLVPVDTLKALLGVPCEVTTYDVAIAFADAVASGIIVDYCGRQFVRATYTEQFRGLQTYSGGWWGGEAAGFFSLTEFPAEGISGIIVNGMDGLGKLRRLHRKLALAYLDGIGPMDDVTIEYVGGYEPLPASLTGLVIELARRQLGSMGVDLTLAGAGAMPGSVKAVSIGQLKVEYVVSTTAADVAAGQASPLLAETMEQFSHVLDMVPAPVTLGGDVSATAMQATLADTLTRYGEDVTLTYAADGAVVGPLRASVQAAIGVDTVNDFQQDSLFVYLSASALLTAPAKMDRLGVRGIERTIDEVRLENMNGLPLCWVLVIR